LRSPPLKIPVDIQELVRLRADFLCEYCHTNERWQYARFMIDHIAPVSEGGEDSIENLCLACFHCNRRKYQPKTTAINQEPGEKIELFNPRQHRGQSILFGLMMGYTLFH
jgi:5-methylcytosine-specific restriction endonuclease McrA